MKRTIHGENNPELSKNHREVKLMIRKETRGMVGRVLESGLGKSGNRIWNKISSKKNSEKGFTLVELIVVLIIITILAAIAIPVALGYIDNAREKEYIADADNCLKGAQTALNDIYNNSENSLTKEKRNSVADLANVVIGDTEFTIWTRKNLKFNSTLSTIDNSGSYVAAYALFVTSRDEDTAKYVFFDGNEWKVYNTKAKVEEAVNANVTPGNVIYMWPNYGDDSTAKDDTAAPLEPTTENWNGYNPTPKESVTINLHCNTITVYAIFILFISCILAYKRICVFSCHNIPS